MEDSLRTLQQLQQRTAMYSEKTLKSIYHFLHGYAFAFTINNLVEEPNNLLLIPRKFHDWVACRLYFFESTAKWCRMIYRKTTSEEEAIEKFFTLYREFCDRKLYLVAKL